MKTTIEINGKLYDARTGKVLLGAEPSKQSKASVIGQSIDGVARPTKSNSQLTDLRPKPTTTQPKPPPASNKVYAQDIKRTKPVQSPHKNHHNAVYGAQKSQTLNRKAVKKPQPAQKPKAYSKSSTPSSNLHPRVEQSATGRGLLLKKVPENRLTRAMSAPKSVLVSKFGNPTSKKPQLSPTLKVQQAPKANHQSKNNEPALKEPVHQLNHKQSATEKRSVFEDHLLKANSHKQKPVKKASRRVKVGSKLKVSPKIISASAAVFAIMLLGGFFAYQNVPSIGMRIAANQAGFSGKLPGSVPAGFAFKGPIEAEPNNIVVRYQSRTDDRNFVIVQRPTNWSSESLLTNFLQDSQLRYQVYRDKGLTVYIYNGSNATWVDKGVWYSVSSPDDTLSSEQLLELASSI